MARASRDDVPVDLASERSQLLVRIPTDHVLLAKRLAARDEISLTEYIDRLIVEDVAAKADAVRSEIASWREQARLDTEEQAAREAAALDRASRSGGRR